MPWNELEAKERVRLWKGLLSLGAPNTYGPRSQLFAQGSPVKHVFLIEHGFAKLEVQAPDGGQAALVLRFPGEWAGLCCACLESPHFLSARTLTESLVHEVDARRLLDISSNLPAAAKLLRETLAAETRKLWEMCLALKLQSGLSRFEGFVANLISAAGMKTPGRGVGVRLPVTDAEIAALISVTPEHLSRIKRKLKAEGRFEAQNR